MLNSILDSVKNAVVNLGGMAVELPGANTPKPQVEAPTAPVVVAAAARWVKVVDKAIAAAKIEADEALVDVDVVEEASKAIFAGLGQVDREVFGVEGADDIEWGTWFRMAFWAALGTSPLPLRVIEARITDKIRVYGGESELESIDAAFPEAWQDADFALATIKDLANPSILLIPAVGLPRKEMRDLKQVVDPKRLLEPSSLMAEAIKEAPSINRSNVEKMLDLMGGERKLVLPQTLGLEHPVGSNWILTRVREQIAVTVTEDGSVFVNGDQLRPNSFVLDQLDGLVEVGVTGWLSAMLVLGYGLMGSTRKAVGGRFAFISEAWVERNSGAAKDTATECRALHKLSMLKVKAGYGFALVVENDEDTETKIAAARAVVNSGVPIAPHHQGSWIAVGDGARAMGVGIKTTEEGIRLWFYVYVDKATKLFNRLGLGIKACAWAPDLVDSPIRMLTRKHGEVCTKGRRYTVAIVNSPLVQEGDGVGILRDDVLVPVGSERKVYTIQVETQSKDPGLAVEEARSRTNINAAPTWEKYTIALDGVPQAEWDIPGTTGSVLKDEVKFVYNKALEVVQVTAVYTWMTNSGREKLAGYATKLTTNRRKVKFTDVAGLERPQLELLIPNNGQKGAPCYINGYAASLPVGMVIDPDQGLTDEDLAAIGKHLEASIEPEWVEYAVSNAAYDHFFKLYGGDTDWEFLADGVVRHLCEVYRGEIVLATEWTSTVENVGTSEMFSELLFGLELIAPTFAKHLWETEGASARRGSFHGALKAIQGDLDKPERVVLKSLADLKLVEKDLDRKSIRGIVKLLGKRFPTGVELVCGKTSLQVDFKALTSLEHFTPGGVARGIARHIAAIARVLVAPKGDVTQQIESLLNLAKAKSKDMIKPGTSLARALRAGELLTRKIATTLRRGVEPGKAHINPLDPVIEKGYLSADEHVLIGRMPMISLNGYDVVLDDQVAIGVIEVCAIEWAMSNEGDADGDGCYILPVPAEFRQEVRKALKTSLLGKQGYVAVYGDNLPYVDGIFAQSKKKSAFYKDFWQDNAFVFNGFTADPSVIIDAFGHVIRHYKANVGNGYGIAARTLYALSRKVSVSGSAPAKFWLATTFAWRIFYEKLGLSGYDADTAHIWKELDEALEAYSESAQARKAAITAFTASLNKLGASPAGGWAALDEETVGLILACRSYHRVHTDLERGRGKLDTVDSQMAALFGFVRRASKGEFSSTSNEVNAIQKRTTCADRLDFDIVRKLLPAECLLRSYAMSALALHKGVVAIHRKEMAANKRSKKAPN